ncbi:MAG: alpha/beta hydrolase, partial [Thermoleophilaceae bacterium]|nr:alpha/beta hydrolase [Thermoleophilaceae bacterium]
MKVAYGEDPSQYCELKTPRGKGPFPVAALFHGGFWRMKYGRKTMWLIALSLRRHGFATWNVEYRRIGAGGTGGWPMTLEDCAAAMDLLAERPEPLDLERVTTVGHSAGGHLSLWTAARHRLPAGAPGADPRVRPARAVSMAGCSDLDAIQALAGGGPSA